MAARDDRAPAFFLNPFDERVCLLVGKLVRGRQLEANDALLGFDEALELAGDLVELRAAAFLGE